MPQWLNTWNARLAKWLWIVVLVGVLAALPVMYARAQTESSADEVAFAMDYRDLLQISASQADPAAFLDKYVPLLKDAGVNAMIVFESTLEELAWAGEVNNYTASQAALLEQRASPPDDNRTYVLFNRPEHAAQLRAMIDWAFAHHGADIRDWTYKGQTGVSIGMGYEDAMLRPMQPNPFAMKALKEQGFDIVPRLSDRFDPFDPQETDTWLQSFEDYGVKRIVFDGDAVTGFGAGVQEGLRPFSLMLKKHGIGIAIFENLKVPQKGISTLAYDLDYDAIRAHPIGDAEMATLSPDQLQDRIVLAVKDRNIRLLYLNAISVKDFTKGMVTHPLDKLADALKGTEDQKGAIAQLKDFGFSVGTPQAFERHHAPSETLLRGLAMLGAVVLCALAFGLFVPSLLLPALVVGAIGGTGLYVLKPTMAVQALALFAAIAAPTAAVVLLIKRIRVLREGAGDAPMSAWRRLGGALLLFVRTTLLSMAAIPLVVAMLNHITYSLVLQQFRGVSLLHLLPIALVALYVFLYGSAHTVFGNAKRILAMPLTVLWIVAIGALGVAGMYYLTRTGNAGQVSGLELQFRSFLENTFGVRPRTKEFLLGHPLFFAGIFLALRYRWGMVLLIAGTIAQLSMVDTFAHIHTPLILSIIRVMLGIGLGLLIGLAGICAWQILEGVRNKWLKSRSV